MLVEVALPELDLDLIVKSIRSGASDISVRSPSEKLAASSAVMLCRAQVLELRGSLVLLHCCGCCSWYCCACSGREVEDKVQSVAFFSSRLPFLSSFPGDLSCLAHFLRGSCGCSPHSSTVSLHPQVRSVDDSDPPRVLPPHHVSVRHVALPMR